MKYLVIALVVLNTEVATSNSTRKMLSQLANRQSIIVVQEIGQRQLSITTDPGVPSPMLQIVKNFTKKSIDIDLYICYTIYTEREKSK